MIEEISSFTGEYRWLSNFWEVPILQYDGLYASVEHAYQAAKVSMLHPEWRDKIRTAYSPGQAKRLGRKAPLAPNWDDIKINVMANLIDLKFAHGSELAERLMDLGSNYSLVEGNNWGDRFWGAEWEGEERGWVGKNILGSLLMARRGALIDAWHWTKIALESEEDE